MTVRGKVGGAATAVLAPEASVVASSTGATAGAGSGLIPGSRGKRPSSAASHRAQIDKIKAQRPVEPSPPAGGDGSDQGQDQGPGRGRRAWDATKAAAGDQTGSPAWWPSNAEPMKAANTGSGFVLGLFVWVGVRAYLEGGTLGVRQLLAAKFLNKTGPTK